MELPEPVEGIRQQEISDFVAAVVEYVGAPVGMFLERQKFHMSEAGFQNILGERLCHFAITKWTVPFFNLTTPRSQMNLVDRKRTAKMFAAGSFLQPARITKAIFRLKDDRRCGRRDLGIESIRISLQECGPARPLDLVFIKLSRLKLRNKRFPDSGIAQTAHRVLFPVPPIEVSHYVHALGGWRPDCK